MSSEKRAASDAFGSSQVVVKRPNLGPGPGKAVAVVNGSNNSALVQAVPRTSGLQAPVMELTGHEGEIFASRFDGPGHLIASTGMDRSISMLSLSIFFPREFPRAAG
jgi:Prp8 binding protein